MRSVSFFPFIWREWHFQRFILETSICQTWTVLVKLILVITFCLPDALKQTVMIVRILDGKPCVVQAENSDVKLHVPNGIKGILLGKIHTDFSRFLHFLRKDRCVVAPMCEYYIHPLKFTESVKPSDEKFRLQVPHTVEDFHENRNKIRVHCFANGEFNGRTCIWRFGRFQLVFLDTTVYWTVPFWLGLQWIWCSSSLPFVRCLLKPPFPSATNTCWCVIVVRYSWLGVLFLYRCSGLDQSSTSWPTQRKLRHVVWSRWQLRVHRDQSLHPVSHHRGCQLLL